MERLNLLREQYMEHMSSRLKSKSLDEDTLLQARTHKEFQFLERNLEELDRAHKKVCARIRVYVCVCVRVYYVCVCIRVYVCVCVRVWAF